jgi:hypothetical protein
MSVPTFYRFNNLACTPPFGWAVAAWAVDRPVGDGGQGSRVFSAGAMFRSLLNIIPEVRSFSPGRVF